MDIRTLVETDGSSGSRRVWSNGRMMGGDVHIKVPRRVDQLAAVEHGLDLDIRRQGLPIASSLASTAAPTLRLFSPISISVVPTTSSAFSLVAPVRSSLLGTQDGQRAEQAA
ncbi:MAG: hypothetical protein MN733_33130 [Nitrososphaera sp.]|nr:hypothetical protein [Nitrososphaera sp.]